MPCDVSGICALTCTYQSPAGIVNLPSVVTTPLIHGYVLAYWFVLRCAVSVKPLSTLTWLGLYMVMSSPGPPFATEFSALYGSGSSPKLFHTAPAAPR